MGSISAHNRPVESLDAYVSPASVPGADPTAVLFTGDTMGVINVWDLAKEHGGGRPRWRHTLRDELKHHRTRINEMVYGDGHLWTGP